MKVLLLLFLFLNILNAMTYAEEEQYNKWATEQRNILKSQALYNQQNSYKNDPIYQQYLKEEIEKEKDRLAKIDERYRIQIGISTLVAIFVFFLLYKFVKSKLLPFVQENKNTKKMFRFNIVISILWLIGWLIGSNPFARHWIGESEMYMFIFIGVLPPALFWAYYWIKNAKD